MEMIDNNINNVGIVNKTLRFYVLQQLIRDCKSSCTQMLFE